MLTNHYPKLMGVLNVTPDSFFDGGKYNGLEAAIERARQMVLEGVDIIDIGGESTRPNATPITPDEEQQRVIPIILALKQLIPLLKNTGSLVPSSHVSISIDTFHPETLKAAIAAGVDFVNDITALQNPEMMALVADAQLPVCLMHMQGTPSTMQSNPTYTNIVQEIYAFFEERIEACEKAGISRGLIYLDPGFGFGKTLEHNLSLLANIDAFSDLGCPLVIGLSRKSMFGQLLGAAPEDRLIPSLTAATIAALKTDVIIRTHDVAATRQAIRVIHAVKSERDTICQ